MKRANRDQRGFFTGVDGILVAAALVLGGVALVGVKVFIWDEDLGPQAQVGNRAASVDDKIFGPTAPACDAAQGVAQGRGVYYTESEGWRLGGEPPPLFDGVDRNAWNTKFAAYRGRVLAIAESESLVTEMRNACSRGQDLGSPRDQSQPEAATTSIVVDFSGTYAVQVLGGDCTDGTPTSLEVSGTSRSISVKVVAQSGGSVAFSGSAPTFDARVSTIVYPDTPITLHLAGRFEAFGSGATMNDGIFEGTTPDGQGCQTRFTARRS